MRNLWEWRVKKVATKTLFQKRSLGGDKKDAQREPQRRELGSWDGEGREPLQEKNRKRPANASPLSSDEKERGLLKKAEKGSRQKNFSRPGVRPSRRGVRKELDETR